ncbi:MAG: DUF1501 domain-containing protein [Fimbriiglobus sp.]
MIAIHRREFLQVGYCGAFGLGMLGTPTMKALARPTAGSQPSAKSAKSVLLIFLPGAMSHIDTLDPKPDAAPEIRGEFKSIPTKISGVHFSELLPQLAARADQFALVRSLSHRENNHLVAVHHLLTGHQQPGAFFDKVASRDDWPDYAGAMSYLRPRSDGIPSGVTVPWFLKDNNAGLTWPGQHAGFLGPKHDPWQLHQNPNAKDFKVENVSPAAGLNIEHLEDRQRLLQELHRDQDHLSHLAQSRALTDQQDAAFRLLTSGKISQAFELNRESNEMRERYGRNPFGQTLLLSRRLIEAGVPVVQANMGRTQNWDSHADIFNRLKKDLVPPLDVGVAALLDDMKSRGLLEKTLVVMLGEFGRTPKLSAQNPGAAIGRDHWAPCFTGLFAGAGVRGGLVIGKSDKIGAYPATSPISPDDVGATIYHTLGIAPETELHDKLNRPVTLNRGQVIQSLFTGA